MVFEKTKQHFDSPSSPSLRVERDDCNEVSIRVSNKKRDNTSDCFYFTKYMTVTSIIDV